jgi:hypothetical protein
VEHYRRAEYCLRQAEHCDPSVVDDYVRTAHVHATLALAGAQAVTTYSISELDDWRAAFDGEPEVAQ